MRDTLDGVQGELLPGNAYPEDFDKAFWNIGESGFWKLERRQTFREPRSESWRAFAAGDLAQARRLTDARRPELAEYYQKISAHGFYTRRARIVEQPISPYLRWELHLLRLRDELGGAARIVDAKQVAELERNGQLPEIVILGDAVMYEVLYDDDGVGQGGVRYTDRELIERWRNITKDLYEAGEKIDVYCEREVPSLKDSFGE
ncbi:DUF6879 family protein [Kutzneria chonburiensis]|uniref:DUF6879 family protein n=1 Tax=Kutzneria chonburiensis TaxID=1483604 RepID=A0ABV6N0Z7_9PSEU|nr:DUF6879 family protein [Kutzneria chonburiensis]